MCFQRSSERIEGKSRPPQSGWKIVPQSRTGCRETPVAKFVVCSWHKQLPDVVGMGPQRTAGFRPGSVFRCFCDFSDIILLLMCVCSGHPFAVLPRPDSASTADHFTTTHRADYKPFTRSTSAGAPPGSTVRWHIVTLKLKLVPCLQSGN